jgi:hypothetical protein
MHSDWLSDCCLTPIQQLFSCIMAKKSWFSMRWWWDPLCTRPTHLVEFILCNNPRIDMPLHSTTLFWFRANSLRSFSLMLLLSGVSTTTNVIVIGLTQPNCISCTENPKAADNGWIGSWRCALDTTLCVKICQWLVTGRWFSPVSSINKTDHHDKTEILLKVALNALTLTLTINTRRMSNQYRIFNFEISLQIQLIYFTIK